MRFTCYHLQGLRRLLTVTCELHLNRQLWPSSDEARRQIVHGDFLQLTVQGPSQTPSSHIQIMMCEQEAADTQRFLFRPSPTPSPEMTSPTEGHEEATA